MVEKESKEQWWGEEEVREATQKWRRRWMGREGAMSKFKREGERKARV